MTEFKHIQFALVPDVPNQNGYIFPKDLVKKMISEFKEKMETVTGSIEYGHESSLNSAFKINSIDEQSNHIYCNITTLNTPEGDMLTKMLNEQSDKYLIGVKYLSYERNDNIIIDAEMHSVGIFPADKIKYKE